MSDLVFLGLLIAFFAVSVGYVRMCDRITSERGEDRR